MVNPFALSLSKPVLSLTKGVENTGASTGSARTESSMNVVVV